MGGKTGYTLTFDDQNSKTINDTVRLSWTDEVTLPATEPTMDGYTFKGWYANEAGTGDEFETGGLYESITGIDEDATLYAKWTEKTYTISFVTSEKKDDATTVTVTDGSTDDIVVTWTETITLPTSFTVAPDTYYFASWKYGDTPVASSGTIADIFGADTDTSITLNAYYLIKKVNVIYEIPVDISKQEGTFSTWKSIVLDVTDEIPQTAYEYDGYTFAGWYYDGSQIAVASTPTSLSVSTPDDGQTTDMTITAKYTANTYTITYDPHYDDSTTTSETYDWNTEITALPEPTRDGYTFTGWYQNEDGKTNKIALGTTYGDTYFDAFGSSASNTGTVYAGWVAKEYDVIYHLNYEGSSASDRPAEVTLGWDDSITIPTLSITRDGYTFLGWSTVSSSTNAEITAGATGATGTYGTVIQEEADLTIHLYAIWSANDYTITFDIDSDTSDVTGHWAEDVPFPDDPTKDGYDFGGWYASATSTNPISSGTPLQNCFLQTKRPCTPAGWKLHLMET